MLEKLKIIHGGNLDKKDNDKDNDKNNEELVSNIIKAMDDEIYKTYNYNEVQEHLKHRGGNITKKNKGKKSKKNKSKKNTNTKINLNKNGLFKNLGISPILYTKIHNITKPNQEKNNYLIIEKLKSNKNNKKEIISDDIWEKFIELTNNTYYDNKKNKSKKNKSKKNKFKKNKSKKNKSRNKKKPLFFSF